MNSLHYFIDLYRTDDTIVLRRRKRKEKTHVAAWFFLVFLVICSLILFTVNIWAGIGMAALFGVLFLLAQTNKISEKNYLFEKDEIFVETRSSLGYVKSRRHKYSDDITAFPSRHVKDRRACYFVEITNGKEKIVVITRSFEEAQWISEVLQAFWNGTADETSDLFEASDSRTVIHHEKNFYRILTPDERADQEDGPLEQGVLKIRCGFCRHVVPDQYVFADTARCACPNCRTLFEVSSLKRETLSSWRRFRFSEDDDRLEIHERLFGWAPDVWLSCGVISGYLGFLALALFLVVYNAKIAVTPEQFGELWQGDYESFNSMGPSFFAFFWGGIALGIGTFLFALWMIMDRRGIRITPTECVLTRYIYFWPKRTKIPRLDVRRIFKPENLFFGYLVHRNGRFYVPDALRLQGIANRYLLTHPPMERRCFDGDDETIEYATLGGVRTECRKFKLHDPSTGKVLPFEDSLELLKEDRLEKAHVIYYPSATILGVGFSRIPVFEKDEQELRFGVSAITDKKERQEKCVESYLPLLILGFPSLFVAVWFAIDKSEWGVSIFCLCSFVGIVLLSLWLHREMLKNLDTEWILTLTKDRLELKRKFRDWEDLRTIPRSEILFAEMVPAPRIQDNASKIPDSLRNGPASIRMKNGELLGIPRFYEIRSNEAMQSVVNEINEFLQESGDTNETP